MMDDVALPRVLIHASDCAVNNAPALKAGPCDCGAADAALDLKLSLEKLRSQAGTGKGDGE